MSSLPKKLVLIIAALVSLALLAAACSSDDDSATPGSPRPTNGFDGETINLGYLTDVSSFRGAAYTQGAQAYWDWLNSNGGVAGKYQVDEFVGVTEGETSRAVEEYEMLKDDVVMLGQVLSTPPTQALLESLKEDNIIAVPGSWAGAWSGEAVLLPTGAAYEYQMINLVDWYVNESGLASDNDIHCAISVDDLYGEVSMRGVRHAIDQLGQQLTQHQVFNRGATDFTAQLEAFATAGCTVVYTMSIPTEQNDLLAQAAEMGFEPDWLAPTPSYLNSLAQARPELYENFYIAFDSPNLNDRSVPAIADFLDRIAAVIGEDAQPNTFHLVGYFQSIAVHALLEKAVELGDLSREGMAAAMAQLGEVDNFGLAAENYVYGLPEDRVPTSAVRIYKFDAEQPPNLLRELQIFDSEFNDNFDLF